MNDSKRNLVNAEEAFTTCSECNHHHSYQEYKTMTTKKKLLGLLLVAVLALLSIVIISEQLIARHLHRLEIVTGPSASLTILTLDQWTPSEISVQSRGTLFHQNGLKLIENGLFWSSELEHKIFPGPDDAQIQAQLHELRNRKVQSLQSPDWLHCGRNPNRYVTFQDGTHACARYRNDHAEFVQGEIMAFYLARLLGITNTPAVVLSEVDSNEWKSVDHPEWPSKAIVALIEWLPNLTKVIMPNILRQKLLNANKGSIHIGSSVLPTMEETDLEHLVQWSDMLVYDYLTGNYDRVSSMQDAAEKEDKPAILKETIHNLAMSETTGSLWFIDNESAFLDAYSLLYDETANGSKFQRFHKKMLQTMCVFRKKTIHRLFALKQSMDPAQLLLEFVAMNEPLFEKLPKIHPNSVFREHFSQRINEVWSWIQECQMQVQYKPSLK